MGVAMGLLERVAAARGTRQLSRADGPIDPADYWFTTGGYTYYGTPSSTYNNTETIEGDFTGLVQYAYKANSVIWAVERTRLSVFSEARFQFRQVRNGRLGDYFGTQDLEILERPWLNGTTGDLLTRMLQDADFAGNAYFARRGDQLRRLRPDWVSILLGSHDDPAVTPADLDAELLGYVYWPGGHLSGKDPEVLMPDEVAHFAPTPDPMASYRGMSWLTPVIREIMADSAATEHKLAFFRNGATPQVVVSFDKDVRQETVESFIRKMNASHQGAANAYRTIYVGGGADVTVVGADLKQLDFKATQGAGETRIAAAGGAHPTIVGLSEGMQGSSLNAGNFAQTRRLLSEVTLSTLWRNAAASMSTLVVPPSGSELACDTRDIPFLREDQRDAADIQQVKASTIRQLIDAGFEPKSVVASVDADDRSLLVHTGLFSVQLQPPGSGQPSDGAPGDAGPKAPAARSRAVSRKFNPAELRDGHGRWTDGPGGAVAGAAKDVLKIADSIPLSEGETFQGSSRVRLPNADVRMALIREADGSPSLRFGVDSQLPGKWHGANGKYTVKLDRQGIDELAARTDELAKAAKNAERDADKLWSRIEDIADREGVDLNRPRRPGQGYGNTALDPLVLQHDAMTDEGLIDEGTIDSPWGQLYYRAVLSDTGAHTWLIVTKPGADLTGEAALDDLRGFSDPARFDPGDMRKLAAALARIHDTATTTTGG